MNDQHSMDPAGVYKEQARRLEAFLAAGGTTLKHSHALQAIALIHGFKDFHLLSHAVKTQGAGERWLVATYGGGVLPSYLLTSSLLDGIAVFLAQVFRVAVDPNVELTIRTQLESEYLGMYAMSYGAPVVSLTIPACVAPGFADDAPLPFGDSPDLAAVANEIQWSLEDRAGWAEFEERIHDERFQENFEARLEDRAMRGASVPNDDKPQAERLDQIVEAAHALTLVASRASAAGGRRHD